MGERMNNSEPFRMHTASVFVVASPFQAFCAIATIRQLCIKEYKIIVCLPIEELHNEQVGRLLKKYNIRYSSIPIFLVRGITFRILRFFSLIPRKIGYQRLFIGDYRNMMEHIVGYNFIRNNADVVYLDDGNPTLNLLNDSESEPLNDNYLKWIKKVKLNREIIYVKNLLTIYGDIINEKFNIKQLDITKAIDRCNTNVIQKDVYIIGTNVEGFCGALEIPELFFIEILGKLMENLRKEYPQDRIVYISHRREKKKYAEELCEKYGCTYSLPEMMVEIEALGFSFYPKAIYGYTSNALFTLKKMFPESRVVNILIEPYKINPFYNDYVHISDYYLKNGIELLKEKC